MNPYGFNFNFAADIASIVASTVPFTPNGDIAATNVQDAIVEVRDDTDSKIANMVTTDTEQSITAKKTFTDGLEMTGIVEPSGFPNQTDSTMTFTDGTRTFSIQPVGDDFYYYIAGEKFTSTGDTVVIDNTEGIHVIYYDGATLTALANPTSANIDSISSDS